MSGQKKDLPYIRRRAFNKIHVTSWLIYLEKDGYVRCSFQNCNFMAFDVEEMCDHYGYCKGDNTFAKFVCKHCNGRTVSQAKLREHLARAHNVDLSEVPKPEEDVLVPEPVTGSTENGKPSRVLVVSWGYFLEKHNYLKCSSCNYLSNTLSEMCRHYPVCKQEMENLLYVCPECKGRTTNVNPLLWHMERSHKIFKAPNQFNHITKTMVRFWKREINDTGYASCLHIFKGKRDCFYFDPNLLGIIEHAQCCKGPQSEIEREVCPHCSRWTDSAEKLTNHVASCCSKKIAQSGKQVGNSAPSSENTTRLDTSFTSNQSSSVLKSSDHHARISVSLGSESDLILEPIEEVIISQETEFMTIENKEVKEELNKILCNNHTVGSEVSETDVAGSTIKIVEGGNVMEQLSSHTQNNMTGSSSDEHRSSIDIQSCDQSENVVQEVVIENEVEFSERDLGAGKKGVASEKVVVISKIDKRGDSPGLERSDVKKRKLYVTSREMKSGENVVIVKNTSKELPCTIIIDDNPTASTSDFTAVGVVSYSHENCQKGNVEDVTVQMLVNTTPITVNGCIESGINNVENECEERRSKFEPVVVDLCDEKSEKEETTVPVPCDTKEENPVQRSENVVVNLECSTDTNPEIKKTNVDRSKRESFKQRFALFTDEFSSDEDDVLVIQDSTQEEETFVLNTPPDMSVSESEQSSGRKVPKNYLRRPGQFRSSRFSPTKRPTTSPNGDSYLKTKCYFEGLMKMHQKIMEEMKITWEDLKEQAITSGDMD